MKSENCDDLRTYQCTRGDIHSRVDFHVEGTPEIAEPGTLEHFLLERYLLFVKRSGVIYSGTVHHVPYSYQPCVVDKLDDSLVTNAGLTLSAPMPDLAHFSPGVNVEVFKIAPA
jgi:uncharacterized protein YqjF (DUF2071 family)